MTTKATKTKATPAPPAKLDDKQRAQGLAIMALMPTYNAAAVVEAFTGNTYGKVDPGAARDELSRVCGDLKGGSMERIEAMLFSQAHALDVMFASLARRGKNQEHLAQYEAHMKLALRAQNQCRATLETLATIKNPPVVFAKQANIAHGHQQVNNGIPAHAGETESTQTELSRLGHEQGQSLDGGTAAAAGGSHLAVATVEAIHRPAQHRGQGRIKP